MPIAARVFVFAVLAFLSGVGVVYAPVLAFVAGAAAFTIGLWSLSRGKRSSKPEAGSPGNAGEKVAQSDTTTTRLVSGFLLLWWLGCISPIIAFSPRDVGGAAASMAGGSMQYQALLIAFGLVGAYFLPRALKRFDPAFRWVIALWSLHLCWMLASLSWSIYPPLTFRNAIAFILLSVGSFGLGAGFYGTQPDGRNLFLRHVFTAGVLSALAIVLPLPFRWGQYDLLDPSQRLDIGGDFPTYVVLPVICALLVRGASTVLGLRSWQGRDWLWTALLVVPLLVLKSRGPILWAMLAFVLFYLLCRARVHDRVRQAGLLLVAGYGGYLFYSEGVFAVLVPYLTRGDVETTMELTGRVPLWEILTSQIAQQPWIGVGFAAFWNPDNLPWVQQLAGFSAVSAHNGYLDMLLGTGAVGLAILLAFCLYTMVVMVGRARRGDPLGWVTFMFLTFYLLQNLTVSIFTEFLELPLIVILALLGLMATRPTVKAAVRANVTRSDQRSRWFSTPNSSTSTRPDESVVRSPTNGQCGTVNESGVLL